MMRIFALVLSLAILGAAPAFAAAPSPVPSPAPTSAADAAAALQAAAWIRAIQAGTIDRGALTPEMDRLLTPALVAATSSRLGPLGAPVSIRQTQLVHQGGNTARVYAVDFAHASLTFVYATDDATGKVSGLRFSNAE